MVGGVDYRSDLESEYLRSIKRDATRQKEIIRFVGRMPHTDIRDLYRAPDISACPSIWDEPFGMVNAEAMAIGIPVVAFRNGGIPEATEDASILVKDCDAHSLANAIKELATNDARRKYFGERGRERVSSFFSWDILSRKWLEIICRQIGEKTAILHTGTPHQNGV